MYLHGLHNQDDCLGQEPLLEGQGFSGEILGDCLDSPVYNAYDDSRPNDKG